MCSRKAQNTDVIVFCLNLLSTTFEASMQSITQRRQLIQHLERIYCKKNLFVDFGGFIFVFSLSVICTQQKPFFPIQRINTGKTRILYNWLFLQFWTKISFLWFLDVETISLYYRKQQIVFPTYNILVF